ncbi:MAG: hypothetical protein JWQ87_3865 [Candidatus Sulfotelmatobacter sp.]|nr:hypothetical protein [Candidatus Sulfotelmatobacter sp.]
MSTERHLDSKYRKLKNLTSDVNDNISAVGPFAERFDLRQQWFQRRLQFRAQSLRFLEA